MQRLIRQLSSSMIFLAFAVGLALSLAQEASAEPWISNRFAQNCSACHSPSRRNVVARDRRCTLACQGCHVNPNGGGIRSEYGVWNQQRWLRSFRSLTLHNKGTPAPLHYQKYGDMPTHLGPNSKNSEGRLFVDMAKDGPNLVVLPDVEYNPKAYDKSDRQEHITVENRAEFMARLTEDDPYRVERRQSVFAGGDFRYFYFNGTIDPTTRATTTQRYFAPMALDLGVRVRPVPDHVQMVFETRSFNSPSLATQDVEWVAEGGSQMRSAYLLIDDLPYATYIMAGLYKPMFGYTTPDHTSLLNQIMFADNSQVSGSVDPYDGALKARSAQAVYKAITVGGSPNVPFINIHLIMPTEVVNNANFYRDSGYALNLGGRFVSYGASFMLSYWDTKGPRQSNPTSPDLENRMLSLTFGGTIKDFILNYDVTNVKREFLPGQADAGTVSTVDAKYRLWRETYLKASWSTSNVARNLKQGNCDETTYGFKTYLVSGASIDFDIIKRNDKDTLNGVETKGNLALAQLHLFF